MRYSTQRKHANTSKARACSTRRCEDRKVFRATTGCRGWLRAHLRQRNLGRWTTTAVGLSEHLEQSSLGIGTPPHAMFCDLRMPCLRGSSNIRVYWPATATSELCYKLNAINLSVRVSGFLADSAWSLELLWQAMYEPLVPRGIRLLSQNPPLLVAAIKKSHTNLHNCYYYYYD